MVRCGAEIEREENKVKADIKALAKKVRMRPRARPRWARRSHATFRHFAESDRVVEDPRQRAGADTLLNSAALQIRVSYTSYTAALQIQSRKAKERILMAKTQINSVMMQMDQQLGACVAPAALHTCR